MPIQSHRFVSPEWYNKFSASITPPDTSIGAHADGTPPEAGDAYRIVEELFIMAAPDETTANLFISTAQRERIAVRVIEVDDDDEVYSCPRYELPDHHYALTNGGIGYVYQWQEDQSVFPVVKVGDAWYADYASVNASDDDAAAMLQYTTENLIHRASIVHEFYDADIVIEAYGEEIARAEIVGYEALGASGDGGMIMRRFPTPVRAGGGRVRDGWSKTGHGVSEEGE